jgi:hypothetical protein
VIAKQPVKEVARFKVDGVGEEERINRYFRLPKTNWFVVASLYSTDESLASKNGADSLDMELSLAKTRRRNIFVSPAYASAEAPIKFIRCCKSIDDYERWWPSAIGCAGVYRLKMTAATIVRWQTVGLIGSPERTV